ncbi:fatty acyl CoA synthetase [Lysobacter sp. GX 14042]|uniref:LolA-related protein n=1 Tax=Lysobacter sp. GX 14042 TaxID=2907155 RepID=UPI001F18B56E|nr:LolA-related protein [Lysobacter sp. GX 14042]MCE7032146.1 fatty acyl CoA synthetase [Lysobacter sp. GX 14042]
MKHAITAAMLLALAGTWPAARAAEPSTGTGVEAGWILERLVRPAPSRTPFVELRQSRLLKTPLRLEGEYRRPADDVLVREVQVPYAETTTLRDGEAVIERAGRNPRRVSLDGAPELAGLRGSFEALLAGDRDVLEREFDLRAEGGRERWTLHLAPKDAALRQLGTLILKGRGSELRCIEAVPEAGAPQRTLLAGAAMDAHGLEAPEALAALCHAPAR